VTALSTEATGKNQASSNNRQRKETVEPKIIHSGVEFDPPTRVYDVPWGP
jgi:hypothetical protein